ncbi:MAG: FxLYD domain-containing protein [Candidatus Rokuibacteriota bacterium]
MKCARWLLAAGYVLGLVFMALPAHAFQIEWQPEPIRQGAARLTGYVRNDDLKATTNLRLRADRLAPDGRVTGTYRAWVPGALASGDRAYFEVRVPEPDRAYRVTVETFDWLRCGD